MSISRTILPTGATRSPTTSSERSGRIAATAFSQIARTKTPIDIAQVYTEFLLDSMQRNARQFVELGQVIAEANAKAWSPFAAAYKRIGASQSGDGGGA